MRVPAAPRLERGWLAACLAALGRRQAPPAAPAALDWDALLAEAEAEDLLPALASAAAAAPPAVRRRLGEALTAARARHLVMTRALAAVLARLEADAIPALPLKGPALAETVYPDPALRPCGDLDILVRREDRQRADAALLAGGHRRVADAHTWEFDIEYDGATLYAGPDGVHVDLHWALVTEPRYAWSGEAETAVWQRAAPLTLAGRRTLGLAREDLVLYLATHLAVHHALAGLRRHWDVALVLASGPLDWDALRARAGHWRARRALYFVLRGVEEAFGPLVPSAALAALAPRGPRAALLDALLRDAGAERRVRLEHLVTLLLVDRGRDACRALHEALLPPAAWLRARYGGGTASRPALYWAHARRLGGVLAGLRH
ncbi:MAG TPA: nucleotidyltransferase family protein [Candidatus Binatia bacterium]|nr:nucleotidyltransferase family protein [Candidatus Binatia bacterium]